MGASGETTIQDKAAQDEAAARKKAVRAALTGDRNFRWLLGGGVISMLGDQFTLIATPWLVLALTGDPVVLGTVLGVMNLPRAVFILVGGAIVDRYSPKSVLMLTKYVNTLLLGLLAVLVLSGGMTVALLYPLVLAIGLASAFSIPSGTSILPRVVAGELLPAANGMMMGLRQLTLLAGPALSGLLLVLTGVTGAAGGPQDARGLGYAFLFDSASFAVSAWTLARVAERPLAPAPQGTVGRTAGRTAGRESVLTAIVATFRHFRQDAALRSVCLYFAAVAFIVVGPLQVALPIFTQGALSGDAATYSQLMLAQGVGTLAGMVLSGARPGWRIGGLGTTMLLADGLSGLLFIPLSLSTTVWQVAPLMALTGMLMGYLQVAVFSWMQRRVPLAMLGRAMSLFMFIFMGLAPLSAALAGLLLRWLTAGQLFLACGLSLLVIVIPTLLLGGMRAVRETPP